MDRLFWVYLLANRPRGAIYLGFTSDLVGRVWKHKRLEIRGHTQEYRITQLVWFEQHATAESGIAREKQLKKWKRGWKTALIENMNPTWRDLFEELVRNQPY